MQGSASKLELPSWLRGLGFRRLGFPQTPKRLSAKSHKGLGRRNCLEPL